MTYLVMECHPAYVIVLDQAGRVIKAANIGYDVGQKIDFIIPMKNEASKPLLLRFAPLAAAACLCAAVMAGGAYSAFLLPYGIIDMSINPHISMDVSYMNRVVGLNGLNDEGIRLTEYVDYKGKNAEEMVELLAKRAVDMGYLSEGGTVHVTANSNNLRWSRKREAVISEELTRHFEGRMNVEVITGEAPEAPPRANAHEPESLPAAVPVQTAAPAPPASQEALPPASQEAPAQRQAVPRTPEVRSEPDDGQAQGGKVQNGRDEENDLLQDDDDWKDDLEDDRDDDLDDTIDENINHRGEGDDGEKDGSDDDDENESGDDEDDDEDDD